MNAWVFNCAILDIQMLWGVIAPGIIHILEGGGMVKGCEQIPLHPFCLRQGDPPENWFRRDDCFCSSLRDAS